MRRDDNSKRLSNHLNDYLGLNVGEHGERGSSVSTLTDIGPGSINLLHFSQITESAAPARLTQVCMEA
jgi:hypothetical protein